MSRKKACEDTISECSPCKKSKSIDNSRLNKIAFHNELIKIYKINKNEKSEREIVEEEHRFIWRKTDDCDDSKWSVRVAKKYYERLFKEYALCDLTFYRKRKVGMRWRTDREVLDGKGQFICGEINCSNTDDLQSWEVNFAYVEKSDKKNALVKLRLCPTCLSKLSKCKISKKNVDKSNKKVVSSSDEVINDEETNVDEQINPMTSSPGETKSSSDVDNIDVWKTALKKEVNREEEFEAYLEELLM